SRRRHTRFSRDWSSDVCSSDLEASFNNISYSIKSKLDNINVKFIEENKKYKIKDLEIYTLKLSHDSINNFGFIFVEGNSRLAYRSEERRVGKECRCRWTADDNK